MKWIDQCVENVNNDRFKNRYSPGLDLEWLKKFTLDVGERIVENTLEGIKLYSTQRPVHLVKVLNTGEVKSLFLETHRLRLQPTDDMNRLASQASHSIANLINLRPFTKSVFFYFVIAPESLRYTFESKDPDNEMFVTRLKMIDEEIDENETF